MLLFFVLFLFLAAPTTLHSAALIRDSAVLKSTVTKPVCCMLPR
jgi:hypothetical protein